MREHFVSLVVTVMERYVLERDVAVNVFQGYCVRAVLNVGFDFHDLRKTFQACQAALELLHVIDDTPDGSQEGTDEQDVSDIIAGDQFVLGEENRAGDHDQDIHDAFKRTCD